MPDNFANIAAALVSPKPGNSLTNGGFFAPTISGSHYQTLSPRNSKERGRLKSAPRSVRLPCGGRDVEQVMTTDAVAGVNASLKPYQHYLGKNRCRVPLRPVLIHSLKTCARVDG